jgi:hypothetical protein
MQRALAARILLFLGLTLTPFSAVEAQLPAVGAGKVQRVAIVPFLEVDGVPPESRAAHREMALAETEACCRKKGIAFVPREEMTTALEALQLVPSDVEDRTKARFRELAERLQVRFLVTGDVENVRSVGRPRGSYGGERESVHARVRFRVFDAAASCYVETWELIGTAIARDEGHLLCRSGALRNRAVREAAREAMGRFLREFSSSTSTVAGGPGAPR